MPTFSRQHFLPQSIAMFLAQQRDDAELVIVSEAPLAQVWGSATPNIRVVNCRAGLSLGEKRNLACDAARGDILIHWDDDDWQANDRITRQVAAFADVRCQISGSSHVLFHDRLTGEAWAYRFGNPNIPWVCGATLAYRRSYWERHRFADITVGEDNVFVWSANAEAVFDHRDPGLCLCAIHPGNTSPKNTADAWWHPVALPAKWKALVERYSNGGAQQGKPRPFSA